MQWIKVQGGKVEGGCRVQGAGSGGEQKANNEISVERLTGHCCAVCCVLAVLCALCAVRCAGGLDDITQPAMLTASLVVLKTVLPNQFGRTAHSLWEICSALPPPAPPASRLPASNPRPR